MYVYEILSILISLGGLYVANKIRTEKKAGRPMVCPLNGNCEQVVHSDFSKIMGVPLEIAGIGYYIAIISAKIIFLIFPALKFSLLEILVYGATFFGFVFSVYLTAIQAFYLKNWCTWCLYSALFSTLVFMTATTNFLINKEALVSVMQDNTTFFVVANLIGYALGTSLAIVTEIITLRFLKDFQIDRKEKINLMYLWQALWSSIFLIVISSFAIAIFDLRMYSSSELFELKSTIFVFIIGLSLILSLKVLPSLTKENQKCNTLHVGKAIWKRNIAPLLSTVLLTSWVVNVFINQIFYQSLSIPLNLTLYLIIIILAVIFAFISLSVSDHLTMKTIKSSTRKINAR